MLNNKNSFYSWLWLIILTFVSVYLNHVIHSTPVFVFLVMLIVMLKGQQITDVFMELLHAPALWRWVLLGYVMVLPLIIAIIYLLF